MLRAIEIFAALIVAAILFHLWNRPPSESALMENFQAHRSAYERLKLNLQADEHLEEVALWGIQTDMSWAGYMPPQGSFLRARFDEYLSLLEEVHGTNVSRSRRTRSVCVGMWGRGFAGETQHMSICWLENEVPGKQVSSIDNIDWGAADNPTAGRLFFYRRLESNWYLERDG